MNTYIKMIIVLFLTILILTACQSSSTSAKPDPKSVNSEENEAEENSYEPSETKNESNTNIEEQTTDKKDQYLEKLQSAKDEVNQLEPKDSSTYALKDVENKRYKIWDDLLNEIYGAIEDQLPKDEMELVRKEQRFWISYRDDTALEASSKYKGGTQEHLEYVAVLANLTKERCYELVEDYLT
ncbi:lysozyme inhibitor LprI family protein [Piscibacillus sp. B03]|uniref:lysozyme inhibitor LprI family protein n=1 Tax=Piscibacillus sp. B03 TaxID=3457430 RepID=UPI003FCCBF0E